MIGPNPCRQAGNQHVTHRVRLFVVGVCVLATLVLSACVLLPAPPVQWAWWGAAALLASIMLAEAGAAEISRDSGQAGHSASIATVPHLAAALLLPPPMAAGLAGLGMLIDEGRARSPWLRLLFNVASTMTSVGLTSLVGQHLGLAGDRLGTNSWHELVTLFGLSAAYFMLNSLPVAAVSTLVGGGSFWQRALQATRFTAPAEFTLGVIGGLAAFVWVKDPYWIMAGIFPTVIAQLALRYISARNRKAAQLSALDRLGRQLSTDLSIEEVFQSTSTHLGETRSVAGCFLHVDSPRLTLVSGLADTPESRRVATTLAARATTTGAPVWVADSRTDAELDQAGAAASSWLVLPLRGGAETAGCFGIMAENPRSFSEEDREFFGLLAERVGLALEGARRAADLVRMAYHDALTGLPNRTLLVDRLQQLLLLGGRRGHTLAVLLLDLDNFKVINDSLGHQVGDVLLQQVAERLRLAVRASDTVARLGGDEFVILLPEVAGAPGASTVADAIASALESPFSIDGREVVISTSIGVALNQPGEKQKPDALLRRADLALYRAKADGRARQALFDPRMEAEAVERMELETALRVAIDRDELRVHYQPIVSLANGGVVGWEALVRWQHSTRGLVSPGAFIPIAEETGLIVAIGSWVLDRACRQVRAWQVISGNESLTISVNVAARQFEDPALIGTVQRALRRSGLPPSSLKLEITESAIMADAEGAVTTLRALKALGIQVAIDDFGTGYSSLAYLKQFPVDILKIDRSFVDGMGRDPHDTAIVRSVVALAKTLELRLTAEGIETEEQRDQLAMLECEFGQGYFFSRPLPPDVIEASLRECTVPSLAA
jgi:diguanylate cyclase (GGDEF)-like protein